MKIFKFVLFLALLGSVVVIGGWMSGYFQWGVYLFLAGFLSLFLCFCCASFIAIGQFKGKNTSWEEFLELEVVSRQCGILTPKLYLYHSREINGYLIKGFCGSPVLIVSSQCFSSLNKKERALLYRYHLIRLRFSSHLYSESFFCIFSLFCVSLVSIIFHPFRVIGKKIFVKNIELNLAQVLKFLFLPLFSLGKGFIFGDEGHSYLEHALTQSVDPEEFNTLSLKIRQSLIQKSLEYDFWNNCGFMGLSNDLFGVSTGSEVMDHYPLPGRRSG